MAFSLFLLNSLLLLTTLINFFTIRRPHPSTLISERVLILLPMRNEEKNVARIIGELERQENLADFKVLIIDDSSDDKTRQIAESLLSSRVAVISAPPPPAGWIGKVSALQAGYLSHHLEGVDYVISIDADVSFAPDAISRAVTTLKDTELDFLSPYPRQIALTWSERLAQPLLQWSWMSTLLLRGAEKFPLQSTVVCNGQFLVMKADSLTAIGGFESVATHVLDDIELGRSFVRAGFKGAVIDGSQIASTRMYSSFKELSAGYGKSLHAAFGPPLGSLIAALFIFATGILPLALSFTGDVLAIAALIAIIGTRLISSLASSARLRDSFLHPASAALFIYLLYFSWRNRRVIQWKGRTI